MNRSYLIVVFSVLLSPLFGQDTVFPGDANANGIVDQYDIPAIGYGIGTTGPARILNEDASESQAIPQFWADNFPSGLNLIHADVDGNGAVNLFDFFIWSENFGIIHDVVQPLEMSTNMVDAPAAVQWNNNQLLLPLTSGATAQIPIDFIIDQEQEVNGLAFRLRYNPGHFAGAFFSTTDNWFKADGNGISLQNHDPGIFNIGMTRFGNNPINGGGTCGTLSLIIIDDMIDLIETAPDTMSTWIRLEGLQLLDGGLTPIPVAVDSFEVKLYRPGTISGTDNVMNDLQASLYPNPSRGVCTISAFHAFGHLTVVDGLGRPLFDRQFTPRRSWQLTDLALSPGYYHLRLEGEKGISWLKMLIQ